MLTSSSSFSPLPTRLQHRRTVDWLHKVGYKTTVTRNVMLPSSEFVGLITPLPYNGISKVLHEFKKQPLAKLCFSGKMEVDRSIQEDCQRLTIAYILNYMWNLYTHIYTLTSIGLPYVYDIYVLDQFKRNHLSPSFCLTRANDNAPNVGSNDFKIHMQK